MRRASLTPAPAGNVPAAAFVAAAVLAALALGGCGPSAEAIKKQKEQAKFHHQLAYGFYFDEHNPNGDMALQEILLSLKLDEANAETHVLAGLIFMGRERYVDAIFHYQRALELDPKAHTARNNLGATYLATERWDDAIQVFDTLVLDITNPNQGHANNNLGWAWYKKGNLDRAEQHFSAARSMAPKLCPAHNNLGMVQLDRHQYHQAIRTLSTAIKQCPHYGEAHYHLGRALARTEALDRAREHFQLCAHHNRDSPLGDRCVALMQSIPPPAVPTEEDER